MMRIRCTASGTPALLFVILGTGITQAYEMSLVEVRILDIGNPPVSVFAMAAGDLGDLGLPAAKPVEEDHSHVAASVTTHHQTMEETSVLEVVQTDNIAIHRAVRSMATGDLGDHGHPAARDVKEDHSQDGATVTIRPQPMEGDSVLGVVLTAKIVIHIHSVVR